MVFEKGKYYKHNTGVTLHVICDIETKMRGKGLLAECNGCREELCVVGLLPENTVGFVEITINEWDEGFISQEYKESHP